MFVILVEIYNFARECSSVWSIERDVDVPEQGTHCETNGELSKAYGIPLVKSPNIIFR